MNKAPAAAQVSDSVQDRMEILKQELELAIRWQRPCLLMAAYSSEYVRADSASMLETCLQGLGQKITWIHTNDSNANSLGYWQTILDGADQAVFFLDGFSESISQPGFLAILKHHATIFSEKNARLVFWLTHQEAATLAYQAPAIWTARLHLIELTASPKPEQVLQNAIESAWQGIGGHGEEFNDAEEKTALQDPFVTGLPKNAAAVSNHAKLLLTLSILQWRKGNSEKANELAENALKFAATMQDACFEAECFNTLALVKSSLGKNDDAVEAYKQAIQLAPEQVFVWNNLGNLCLKIDRPHEALIAFQKALDHNTADPIAWNGMGDVYSHSNYVDDAIAAYRKSIELAPSLPRPWIGLGEIYAHSGQINEAVTAFQKATQCNKQLIRPWLGLARLHSKQEHYREAIRAYQQALLLDSQNSSIWNELGCVHLKAGRHEDAIETIGKAIELDHSFGWAYSNLALAHASCEHYQESIPLYLKSLDLLNDKEQRTITWNRLANAYRMLNNYENAIKAYQMADARHTDHVQEIIHASDSPKPASVSEAAPAPETETAQPVERSVENSTVEPASQPEEHPETEAPYWVFHTSDVNNEMPAHLFQESSYLFGTELTSMAAQSATATQEIGGLSMQMTIPFFPDKQVFKAAAIPKAAPVTSNRPGKVDTSNARMWNEKGNLLFRAGAVEDAIRAYNKAIKCDYAFGWSYCNLGIAYLHLRKFAEAILLLQKSLELLTKDREQAVAWNELGNLYRCLNDYHNAVAAYRKSDELDPEHAGARDTVEYLHAEPNTGNAQVWNQLGDSFFKASAYSEASDCYRKATEMEPHSGWAFSNLALSLTLQSKFEDAVPLYLKSIELFKEDKHKADAWNRLGNVYRRLDDYDNAIAAYQHAVKLSNENASLLKRTRFSLLGNCYVD
jgi:tetratricopeptide (TPR) repeat protein